MKTNTFALLILAAAALPLVAQTTTTAKPAPTTAHATSTATAHRTPGCARLPEISPKIPALPAGLPCAKPLYTITRTSETRLDYASPLVSPELKASLSGGPTTYSLNYIDTKVGTGELAKPGKFYTVHYTGYLLKDGTKFDSSLDRGDPITFPYGGHRVIPGWGQRLRRHARRRQAPSLHPLSAGLWRDRPPARDSRPLRAGVRRRVHCPERHAARAQTAHPAHPETFSR